MQTDKSRHEIGARLKQARISAKYSQEEVSAVMGLTRQAVAAWERGYSCPTAVQLSALCIAYGCSADAILFGMQNYGMESSAEREFDALPLAIRNKTKLLWQVFARRGVEDPVVKNYGRQRS